MKLHVYQAEFEELTSLVAHEKHISESAVRRDSSCSQKMPMRMGSKSGFKITMCG